MTASHRLASAGTRMQVSIFACALLLWSAATQAAGTPVGTVIENTATVQFDLAGTPTTVTTNTTTITVVERIDVVVTLQSPQTLGSRQLLFKLCP